MSSWREEPVVFDCEGDVLVGILHRAAAPDARLGLLVVVGGPQYRVGSHRQFVLMARDLASVGYPVLRFDYRGMGDADGAARTFEDVEADLQAATVAFQEAVPELAGIVLWGLCDAASAIMMSASPPVVKGRILVNPWARTEAGEARAYVRHYYLRRVLQRDFWRKLASGVLDVRGSISQFGTALRRATRASAPAQPSYLDRMLEGASRLRSDVLVLLSGRDLTAREFETLRYEHSAWRRFLDSPRVSVTHLPDADHTFSNRASLDDGVQVMCNWIGRLRDLDS